MLTAFEDAGLDVGTADLILGTSAGSIVGSRIASGESPRAGVDRVRELARSGRAADKLGTAESPGALMKRFMDVMVAASELPPRERLVRLGTFALEAQTIPEDEYVARYSDHGNAGWPPRFRCTAIEARTGEFVVWDEKHRIGSDRAVASSCSVPGFFPPVTINGKRYYDGGLRSIANADMAAGHERVLILTLANPDPDSPDPRAQHARRVLDGELAVLREAGASTEVVSPDEETRSAMGMNLMDPTNALAAAEAGLLQGKREAQRIADFWS
jgi:NTE family protein